MFGRFLSRKREADSRPTCGTPIIRELGLIPLDSPKVLCVPSPTAEQKDTAEEDYLELPAFLSEEPAQPGGFARWWRERVMRRK